MSNYCSKCGGPVTLKQQVDSLGNRIQSIRCWNGHYEKLIVENIKKTTLVKESKDAFPMIGFFSAR